MKKIAKQKSMNKIVIGILICLPTLLFSQDNYIYTLKYCSKENDTALVVYYYNKYDSLTYTAEATLLKDFPSDKKKCVNDAIEWTLDNLLLVGTCYGGWMIYPDTISKRVINKMEEHYVTKDYESLNSYFNYKEYQLISIEKHPNNYTFEDYQKAEKPNQTEFIQNMVNENK